MRAGEAAEVTGPFGTYQVTMASGTTWYGDAIRFGPRTSFSKVDCVREFKVQDGHLLGHELIVNMVREGNLSPSRSRPSSSSQKAIQALHDQFGLFTGSIPHATVSAAG